MGIPRPALIVSGNHAVALISISRLSEGILNIKRRHPFGVPHHLHRILALLAHHVVILVSFRCVVVASGTRHVGGRH